MDQRGYVDFLEAEVLWYRWHANKAMWLFGASRLILTVLSAALPAIVTQSVPPLALTAIAVTISILTALDTQFRWGDEWRQYRTTQLGLKRLLRVYSLGDDGSGMSPDKRMQKLVEDAEGLIAKDAESFFKFRIMDLKKSPARQAHP